MGDIVPVPGVPFEETLASASPDLLREMIKGFAQRMMDAEVETLCGAGYGEVSQNRVNSRNGYRPREWDTRAGAEAVAFSSASSAMSKSDGPIDLLCARQGRAYRGCSGADEVRVMVLPAANRAAALFRAGRAAERRAGSRRRSLPRLRTVAAKSSSAWQAASPSLVKRPRAMRSLRWPLAGSTVAPRRL